MKGSAMNRSAMNRSAMNRAPFGIVLLALTACSSSTVEEASTAVVVSQVGFGARTGESVDGVEVAVGLDLDGRVLDGMDELGCRRTDFMAPDGRPGVDNQFTFIYETVSEIFLDGVVEGIIQNSIIEGRLLLICQISEVEDLSNDDQVEVAPLCPWSPSCEELY